MPPGVVKTQIKACLIVAYLWIDNSKTLPECKADTDPPGHVPNQLHPINYRCNLCTVDN